jgi:NADH-quinone oxidoreductase subunit G
MKVTIDGREVDVPAGTTVLRAAKQAGVEIPVFCYHPGLSIPANCRMCLVEIEKVPKPLPACYTEVSEGMVVRTQTEKVKATQQAVLEFILLNHPVDCPICDQAGECVLQEHYVRYSGAASRLIHEKTGKPKAKVLGPTVVLDAERCVVCTRCVRFCNEVSKSHELEVEERGERSEITTPEGVELNNPYSLNVVDICPVGALTSREFRFRRRVWFLDMRDSVCTGCARGCSVRVDSHANKVERIVPRYNPDVNKYWMCDDGRRSLDPRTVRALPMGRVPGPGGEGVREAPALDGLRVLAGWLKDGGKTGIALSASLTNEDVYAWARLAKLLGAAVYVLPRAGWQGDTILRTHDRDCNSRGTHAILEALVGKPGGVAQLSADAGNLAQLVVLDNEVDPSEAVLAALGRVARVAVLTDLPGPLAELASVVAPLASLHQREGTITNVDGWVQRLAAPLKPAVTAISPHAAAAYLGHHGAVHTDTGDAAIELDFTEKTRPAELFDRIAGQVPAFAGLSYGEVGDLGRGLPVDGAIAPRRSRVNGTPQWEPDPVMPTAQRPWAVRRGA